MAEREVCGIRICTEERIEKMSQGSLERYKKAIKKAKLNAHGWYYDSDSNRDPEEIRALDWAWNTVKRELEKREEEK
jgi:cation transport regulator ChaB